MKFVNCLLVLYITVLSFIENSKIKTNKANISYKQINDTIENQNFTVRNLKFYDSDYYDTFSNRLFEVNFNKKCNVNRCYYPYGICEENKCKCLRGYLNNQFGSREIFCSYKIKSQLYAFLLETFTLIGGDIYLEFYEYAIIKGVCLLFLIFIFTFNLPCKLCGGRDLIDSSCVPCTCFKTGTMVICVFGLIVWEITDLLRIMSFKATDNNLYPLDNFF